MTYFSQYERPEGSYNEIIAAFVVVSVSFLLLAVI